MYNKKFELCFRITQRLTYFDQFNQFLFFSFFFLLKIERNKTKKYTFSTQHEIKKKRIFPRNNFEYSTLSLHLHTVYMILYLLHFFLSPLLPPSSLSRFTIFSLLQQQSINPKLAKLISARDYLIIFWRFAGDFLLLLIDRSDEIWEEFEQSDRGNVAGMAR